MSSSNNAAPAPADTVINVRNYTRISIPNQNISIADILFNRDTLSFLISWMLLSLFLGTYYIFPILFPISLCSLFMAVYGNCSAKYYFLIPLILTVAWNTIYAIICVIFYITFYAGDKEFFLNKALYFCWTEKAEIFEKISDIWILFVSNLIFTVFEIMVGIGIIFVTKLRYAELQKKYVEELRRVYGEQAVKSYRESLQQNGLVIVSNERLQSARVAQATQNLQNENPPNAYAELMAQIPSPLSYQSNTILSPLQNGTPPPTYSMLERDQQFELDSLNDDASQHSINNQQLLSDITQNSNTTLSSPINNSNNSTAAMSSSSSILD